MKVVGLSGVFALASAGLAFASVEPSATVKSDTEAVVSVTAVDAALIDKKSADVGTAALVSVDCTTDPGLPICSEAAAKN